MAEKMKQGHFSFKKNFSIIAHISHGKSTLADRFLELTKTISQKAMRAQYLDSMPLEREKGITIKMHPVRLVWKIPNQAETLNPKSETLNSLGFRNSNLGFAGSEYILNLIDTPGHIDFCYETSRALACVEGAVLLVDVMKGIQAQTLFNLQQAREQDLKIIGAVNKIDLATEAQIIKTKRELADVLSVPEKEIFAISAKDGTNVEAFLKAIIERIPPPRIKVRPSGDLGLTLKALVFDSKYDLFSGVIAYVRVFEGEIKRGDKIYLIAQDQPTEVKEVGYFSPQLKPCSGLKAGEIGYIKTGVKTASKVKVGDTIIKALPVGNKAKAYPLPGYREPQPVLFLSLYPHNADDFERLKEGLEKLKLNDPALGFQPESKMALGRGFRTGFLGSLHAEITIRRLKAEFGLDLIATSPQVIFKVLTQNKKEIFVSSPALWPSPDQLLETQEPWVELEIVTPNTYFNAVFKILKNFSASLKETKYLGQEKSILLAEVPLREIVSGNFYDRLKSSTQGYASFNFKPIGFRQSPLVKMNILIAGVPEESLSRIVPRDKTFSEGKKFLQKLKEVLPPQQFAVSLQAAVYGKIIARETIRALRKDVTAPLYGGDVTRKRKLLDAQKKGKKKLKEKGRVHIPAETFLEILKD